MKSNFVDSLPPGWTMKERIRGNGKRDKFYYPPGNGPRFNSKVEVFRYLGANRIDRHKPKRKKKKCVLKQSWKIVAVEKVKAEDLPSGWIGEIRVKESDHTIRRDPYYIDPVTKTLYRSLKAVYRRSDDEFTISDDGKSVASRTRRQINIGQSPVMNMPIENRQGHDSSSQPLIVPEQIPREDGKLADLPRRSKRLAGIEVDTVGLKPKTRARRDGSDEIEKPKPKPKPSSSDTIPLGELILSDPCIAFAIRILKGPTSSDNDDNDNSSLVGRWYDHERRPVHRVCDQDSDRPSTKLELN